MLAFGIQTTIENAILIRVDSANSKDLMQIEIINGNVVMVYNLGTENHVIGEMNVKVNDDVYHVVRFTRSEQNSTMQIDNHNKINLMPSGRQLKVFNNQSKVQIGGKKDNIYIDDASIDKPFNGIISGLVFNGLHLLDLAAEHDSRIDIEGDVELVLLMVKNVSKSLENENTTKMNFDDLQMQEASDFKSLNEELYI